MFSTLLLRFHSQKSQSSSSTTTTTRSAPMALSFFSNWGTSSYSSPPLHQNLYPDINNNNVVFQPRRKKPRPSNLSFTDSYASTFNVVDPLILQTNNDYSLFSDHHHHHLLPTDYYSSNSNSNPLFPLDQQPLDSGFYGINDSDHHPELFNGYNCNSIIPEFFPDVDDIDQLLLAPILTDNHVLPQNSPFDFPLQEEDNITGYDYGGNYYNNNNNNYQEISNITTEESKKKKPSGSTVVSPQSIAARERRKKITEKTQELGRLIPGGNKMSTAEMFQAASKYVKFLQAQVAVLQEMKEYPFHIKALQVLGSPTVQEKLYSEEKCLVPKELIDRTRSNRSNVEDID